MITPETLCPTWTNKLLGDSVVFLDHLRRPITAADRESGPHPYYGANGQQDSVAGYIFDEPLILLAEDGGYFGDPERTIAYRVQGKCWVNNHAHVLRPKPGVDINFLCRLLERYDVTRFINGATRQKLNKGIAEQIPIAFPSLDEQRRIAAILDKADAIRSKRQESIRLTEEFLRSTFLEMFGDPVTNQKRWESVKLEQLCSKITDGTHKTPTYVESGVIFISAKNIKKYRLDWNDVKYITSEEHEFLTKRCKAEFGDILLSKSGSIGAAAKVRVNYEFSLFESLALIKYIRNKVNGDYLQHYLNSDHMKRRYVSDTKGLAIRHLHLNEIRNIDVLLPPLNLQNQFSDIINSVESTSAKQVSTNCSFNELFESLTHRAFRGEL